MAWRNLPIRDRLGGVTTDGCGIAKTMGAGLILSTVIEAAGSHAIAPFMIFATVVAWAIFGIWLLIRRRK